MEKYEPCKKDPKDRRKKVSWAVFSYFNERGEEYRRAFTMSINTPEIAFFDIAPITLTTK